MNGVHDCGGMQDMGPINYTASEPPFHARWEARVLAMSFAVYFAKNVDITVGFRPALENLPPVDYLRMSYWELWFAALKVRLLGSKLLTKEEIATGRADKTAPRTATPATPTVMAASVMNPRKSTRPESTPAKFEAGYQVRARNINPPTHTRLPRYARGKLGTIVKNRGVFVFLDSDEENQGENPQPVYSVRFSARELWGSAAPANDSVYLDLWESHLEPA